MATGKITLTSIKAAEPGKADVFLWDTEQRGFGLKVTPKGAKVFLFQYRLGGRGTKTKRWTIGRVGDPWTPDNARTEAKRLATLVAQGADPVEEWKERQRLAATLGFTAYIETFAKGYLEPEWGSSWPMAKRQLEMHAAPHLGDRPMPDIRAEHINPVFDSLVKMPALRRNVWAVMHKMFRWADKRGDIPSNPMAKMDAPPTATARKRVLTDDELIAAWRASYTLEHPRGPLVRLLILTLQRRCEVAGMPWKELSHNERLWLIDGSRTKNSHEHLVPLNDLSWSELEAIGWKRRGLAMPCSTGNTAVSNFSKTKTALDKAMKPILQELADKRADAEGEPREAIAWEKWERWTLHDLRRTGTTRLQRLKFPIEVTERVINHHRGGEASGIKAVYNTYDYQDEKTRALEAWGAYVHALVNGAEQTSNIVQLAAARA
jgi:integrase